MNLNIYPVTAALDARGHLTLAGMDLNALAEQYGTPLYLYDAETVRQQVQRLQSLLQTHYAPAPFEITYASKAYFSLGMARHLAGLNLGVDVVSRGELKIAQRAGFLGERVHLHGNNKSLEEMTLALKWGVQSIVVDSLEELEYLDAAAGTLGCTGRVWLRITPGVAAHTHHAVQTGHSTSKFGFPIEGGLAAEGIRAALAAKNLRLTGLHTHLGSQIFEIEAYERGIQMLLQLADDTGFVPEEFSPGGGWGVPYTPDVPENDLGVWIAGVCRAVKVGFTQRGWPLPKLVLEPGRRIVAKAGLALYTVGTTKKHSDGLTFVAVDGGMADNPRPALYQAQYTACLVNHPDGQPQRPANVVGKFCETGDQLIEGVNLPEAHRGDLLAIPVAGAYQLSMSSNYNLATRPAVLWLDEGKVEVLQPREYPEESAWWLGETSQR